MSVYPPVRSELARLLCQARLSPYKQAVPGANLDAALDLYIWNLSAAMAMFETVHYFEVGLRKHHARGVGSMGRATGLNRAVVPQSGHRRWRREPLALQGARTAHAIVRGTSSASLAVSGGASRKPCRRPQPRRSSASS